MKTFRSNLHNRAFVWALLYLVAIYLGQIAIGWSVIAGGNPLTINNVGMFDGGGQARSEFRPGDLAVVYRKACSTHSQVLVSYPELQSAKGFVFPLPVSMSQIDGGCAQTGYGFTVPPLPPGQYTFVNRISFQNNLVGRNESATYPFLHLWITQ
jgi:hypothetical protein